MKNKNIVLFSSGVSEKGGIPHSLRQALGERGYTCSFWRDLFDDAKDHKNIALLPMLIKKIPTFDYAVLICEGHDVTEMLRNGSREAVNTMRDNVLFEIGLCAMALGLSRTILVTDEKVYLPDDLVGLNNELALKRIVFFSDSRELTVSDDRVPTVIERISEEIDCYIRSTGNVLSPVVVGAASSTAAGYVTNFIFRALENIDKGICINGNESDTGSFIKVPDDKIFFHVILPDSYSEKTHAKAEARLRLFNKAGIPYARKRSVELRYYMDGDEFHIVDYPTTIVTAYDTAKMILHIEANDEGDENAYERFVSKELNMFEATVKYLAGDEYLSQVINEQYADCDESERARIFGRVKDIVDNRLTIERENYC